jgi:hypothetical protein
MAKKKDENQEVETQEQSTKDIQKTDETEQAAQEVLEAQSSDKELNKKYKLADPNTSYQEEGFTLAGEQEKELPDSPSQQLIERIRHGYIVEV